MPHKRARMCPTNEHDGRKGGVAHRGERESGARGPKTEPDQLGAVHTAVPAEPFP